MTVSRTVKTAILMILILFEVGFESVYQVAVAAETPGLFISLSGSATAPDKQTAADLSVFRSRLVRIDWDRMRSVDGTAQGRATASGSVVLNLFEDAVFNAVLDRREVRSTKKITWSGHIEGVPRSHVTLVVENGVMVGNVRVADSYFQVRYVGADMHVIQQIDESRFPPDGEPIPVYLPAQGTIPDFGIAAADDGSTFDVMVVYTPAARAAAGGTTAINALINLAVAETNTAYAKSGIFPRLRLIHTEEVAYTESGNFSTDLNRITNPSDGFMDNVHPLRNAHGADLVSLIVEGTSLCGIAWLMTTQSNEFEALAFSVVARICATGNYSFGHELGHNMGLQHDRAAAPANGVFPFSHGYVDIPHNFRDIMGTQTSCITCVRIQNFSNPNVTFNGFPTGVSQALPQSADAAASLNATAFTVANWRAQIEVGGPLAAVDFDGDGRSDVSIYREGGWYILRSSDGGVTAMGWGGLPQDIPVPADYDGDGKVDIAVYRDGTWYIIRSSDGGVTGTGWGGLVQDIPVPADYDGDGKTDLAVYRDGNWYIIRSSDGGVTAVGWGGLVQDILVPADYDGDGKADVAIYRNGTWFVKRSSDGGQTTVGWGGLSQDIPVPADYDGDGKADIAAYRDGMWFILRSSDGGQTTVNWGGLPQDIPLH